MESDIRRDAIGYNTGAQASSATNWIHDESALQLQKALDQIKLKLANERTGIDRDEAGSWLRWLLSVPSPALLDMSEDLRRVVNSTLSDYSLDLIDQTREGFLSRVACRLVVLPSGAELSSPLVEPPSSIVYGKLLYGGVTRCRWLSTSGKGASRQAGQRTEVKARATDNIPPWLLYGGPSRSYQAVDIGPAVVLEVVLLNRGKTLKESYGNNMVVEGMTWKPQNMFDSVEDRPECPPEGTETDRSSPSSLSGKDRNDAFRSDFQSSVGGLQDQINAIVRRVLDGRVIRPADVDNEKTQTIAGDDTNQQLSVASLEAEELALLGLTPVRGLLLFGPPGCGKTALARQISLSLKARSPKIVSAPELLDRWVGGSEKLVRALFSDAEAELASCNGDATKSALHVIVIDEIDAVFRKRSSSEDSGEATRSSVVNQILAKLDGVNSIPNVLLIGMTNRRELLDEALLRPGRLEVQIEIPLPNQEGRREILGIHFEPLRKRGRLSPALCNAIEGTQDLGLGSYQDHRPRRKRDILRGVLKGPYDLAADYATKGFSGADIAGLVRNAGSIALSRARKDGTGVDGILVTLEDVKQALGEIR